MEISGFYRLFLNGGNRKRDAICSLIAKFPYEIAFADEFPLTQEELRLRERIKVIFALESLEKAKNTFSFSRDEVMSATERSKRAKLKKQQKAAFDHRWRQATEAILYFKAHQMPEREIAGKLNELGITSRNDKQISQGTVNRLYHQFVSTYKNMRAAENAAVAVVLEESLGTSNGTKVTSRVSGPKTKKREKISIYEPEIFNDIIEWYLEEGTYEEIDFNIEILNRDKEVVETLFVRKEYVLDGKLKIDVLKNTLLVPGYYVARFFGIDDNGDSNLIPSDVSPFIVGEKFGKVKDIKMGRSLDGDSFFPIYVGEERRYGL